MATQMATRNVCPSMHARGVSGAARVKQKRAEAGEAPALYPACQGMFEKIR